MSRSPHVMLFDLYAGGHHGQYIRQLVEYWGAHNLPGRLSVTVTPLFLERHADVARAAQAAADVHLVPVEEPVPLRREGALALGRNDRTHGRLLRRYLDRLRPDHAVLMYFDHVQLSLALDLRFGFPVRLSGIYFRPSFHYARFEGGVGLKERLRGLRKRAILSAALRNPHLSHLFCLDPYVVPHVQALRRRAQVVALPDGVALRPAARTRAEQRIRWDVPEGRRVALFFGSITERKGIYQILQALPMLPPEAQHRLCLVIAGRIHDRERHRVYEGLRTLREATAVHVLLDDRFVEEEEIQGLIRGADLVLVPYQQHLGSSGVLVRAATEEVPVLGSDYGLLGEHLRRRVLGRAVDTTSPRAIAGSLERWLTQPDAFPFDVQEARRFARENTAEGFAETIFRHTAGAGAIRSE